MVQPCEVPRGTGRIQQHPSRLAFIEAKRYVEVSAVVYVQNRVLAVKVYALLTRSNLMLRSTPPLQLTNAYAHTTGDDTIRLSRDRTGDSPD